MGRKGKKQQDDYWDSEAVDQDAAVIEGEEKPEEATNAKGKTTATKDNQKNAKGGKDQDEEEAKPQQGGKKGGKARRGKQTEEFSEEDLEKLMSGEVDQEDEKPAAKQPAAKTKQSAAAPKKEEKKEEKKAAPAKKAEEKPKTTTSTDNTTTADNGESNNAETGESTEDTEIKGKKKKKGAKATEEKKKKGGIGKKAAELIIKMREEEEKRKQEEEERRKKEEEDDIVRQQEEEKLEKIRQEKKAQKKLKEKEKKLKAEQRAKEEKLAKVREQFQAQGLVPGSAETAKPKRPIYGNKKPNKKKNEEESGETKEEVKEEEKVKEVATATPATAATPVATPAAPQNEEKKEEEAEDWEARDDWESLENEDDVLKPAEPAKPKEEEKPAVTPTPAPVKEEPKAKAAQAPVKKAAANNKKGGKKNEAPAAAADVNDNGKEENEEPKEKLRSPICCVLGHVDTGKTKLLDKIRRTNVQEGEAGGITQQIGATYFPMEALREQTNKIQEANRLEVKVPGLLIIDTPGHASFTNLRSRGSSLCDIAILVVDITAKQLEQQTIESINLLKMRKTPFIIALNKVDRIYGWKTCPNTPIKEALRRQDKSALAEFETKVRDVITFFAEQSLNATLYYTNKDFRKYVSIVPTSAVHGEGIPDLLMLLVQLTQRLMIDRLLLLEKLQCTVLEVKMVEGFGTTIDVILVNGVLREGDTIVLCGLNGPIVTTIRALLTPQPMKEIRVKGTYIHHKEIHASQGVKISAPDLDKAVAGSSLLVVRPGDDIEDLKNEVMADLEKLRSRISTTDIGVYVQASTLGSLEALLEFLKESKIPVSGINIGPLSKRDVIKSSIMLEKNKEYAVILAFDIKVPKDVAEHAEELGVRIFTAEIIYHLFDQFTAYMDKLHKDKQTESAPEAVFPCRLKIIPEYIFNKKEPIVLGVDVLEGTLKLGTPICVPSQEFCYLGRATGIEINHKAVTEAKVGSQVALKIEQEDLSAQQKVYGRHFDHNDELVSKISRQSIDVIKSNFSDQISKEDIRLMAKLMAIFGIQKNK